MSKAIPPTKLKIRSLYRLLSTRTSWSDTLMLDEASVSELDWWICYIDEWNGKPVKIKPVECQIFTDASDSGWGAVWNGQEASGVWNPEFMELSINYRELLAVFFAIQTFSPDIQGKSVQIMCDNVTAVAYINNLGGPGPLLTELAEAIWALVWEQGLTLQARHLAGATNVWADYLSRLPLHYEWKLHPALFSMIDNAWGYHTVDRFACLATTQLPRYNSRYHDPMSEGVDALAQQNWGSENNYVNPPFRLINKVLDIVVAQQAVATLIAPKWPNKPWYHKLQELSIDQPLKIPNKKWAMLQMGNKAEPLKNTKWQMYAWRIYGGTIS